MKMVEIIEYLLKTYFKFCVIRFQMTVSILLIIILHTLNLRVIIKIKIHSLHLVGTTK